MSDTIAQRCEAIKDRFNEYYNHHSGDYCNTVDYVLGEIHTALSAEIEQCFGLQHKITLKGLHLPYTSKEYDHIIEERCGVKVLEHIYSSQNRQDLEVGIDSPSLHSCTIKLGDGTPSKLNFEHLAHEIAYRESLWDDHLGEFAQECINELKKTLASLPNKFYGIPSILNLTDNFLDRKYFEVPYRNLRTNSLNSLSARSRSDHGAD